MRPALPGDLYSCQLLTGYSSYPCRVPRDWVGEQRFPSLLLNILYSVAEKVGKHKNWRGSQTEKPPEAAPVLEFALTMFCHFDSWLRILLLPARDKADFPCDSK